MLLTACSELCPYLREVVVSFFSLYLLGLCFNISLDSEPPTSEARDFTTLVSFTAWFRGFPMVIRQKHWSQNMLLGKNVP